jgi:Putative adhesin
MRILDLSCICVVLAALAMPSRAAVDGRFDQTLQVSAHVKVDVATETGDISIRAGETGTVEIHARLHGNNEGATDQDLESRIRAIAANPPIVRRGDGSVQIGHFSSQNLARNISISYEIVVPADAQLRSETGSGDQTLDGVQGPVDATSGTGNLHVSHIGGDATVDAGSGDIDLRDIRGKVHAKTGTGSIQAAIIGSRSRSHGTVAHVLNTSEGEAITFILASASGQDIEILTGSGDVQVEDFIGGLQITAGSGSIRVSGNPTSDWHVYTGSGTVRVQLPQSANLSLEAHTSSGTIEAQTSISIQGDRSSRDLRGQVGKGGPTVDLKTASGNIEIE